MKINVSKNHLFTKLRTVGKIVKPGKEVAYSSFLFEVKENVLTVTGCDESGQISTVVECDILESEDVSFLIDSTMLLNSLKELPDQPIEFDIQKKETSFDIKINYYCGHFAMVGSEPSLFPRMGDLKDSTAFTVSGKSLKKGLSLYKFASTDELRPVMTTVNISVKDGVLAFAASSGHVLGIHEETDHQVPEGVNVSIPGKITKIVSDIMQENEDLSIEYNEKNIHFVVGGYVVKYRLFEGKYPNYRSVVPNNHTLEVKINCAGLIAAINRVSIFAKESAPMVALKLENNNLFLTAQDIDYNRSAKEDIFLDSVYPDFQIGFKSNYLIDVLKGVESETCIMNLTSMDRAALILPADRTDTQFVLMPMMINS